MEHIETQIDIAAPPERVWAVLTDFAAYPQWNPFIPNISGSPTVDSRLIVRLTPPSGRGVTLKPTVKVAEPPHELRWLGHVVVPHVFDGEHQFLLEAQPEGTTRLTQAEDFSGFLVPLMKSALINTRMGFEQMNAALKQRVESTG